MAGGLERARTGFTGETALAAETGRTLTDDLVRIAIAAFVVNFVLLCLFLRALVAPLYLLLASALACTATLGLTTYVFQGLLGQDELTYYVPFAVAVLLVSLGSDYNVFLVGRVWQEAERVPVRRAIAIAARLAHDRGRRARPRVQLRHARADPAAAVPGVCLRHERRGPPRRVRDPGAARARPRLGLRRELVAARPPPGRPGPVARGRGLRLGSSAPVSSPDVSAIAVSGLRKAYGQREVLHGISFTVEPGEVFALLGPNGAGKTTTVEILEGYRARDEGDVEVLGEDPGRAGSAFRARIGIVLQSSAVYHHLSVRELVALFAGYYPSPRSPDEVIELVGLAEKHGARVRTLSGGQLRRLDLALALVGDPELVFLDEPTTGFDPAARRQAWETIRDLRSLGKSILLTTHYMEEAHGLADRVAIMRSGRIVGTGSPQELLSGQASVEIRFRRNGDEVVIATEEPTRVLHELTAEALAEGRELEGLEVHRRTLEDVYLELTHEGAE